MVGRTPASEWDKAQLFPSLTVLFTFVEVAERSKAIGLSPITKCFAGSNPALDTYFHNGKD